ncbi:MAG: nitroreductase family protein [Marinilabiliaceae bacterium]|nr:nitroreductase family protein [Marinilabiliaceae bacterium]
MNQLQLIQNRRSCRIFTEQTVEETKIETLLKAALWSPTSKNNRPWEFVVVDDKNLISQLSLSKPHGAEFLKGAPLAIVLVADPQKSDVWVEDTAIAATLIQLTAEDIGLGSCWIQTRLRDHADGGASSDFVKKLLNIPADMQVASIIAIGYKAKERKPYTDDVLNWNKVHRNKF